MAKTTTVNTDEASTYELGQSSHAWIFAEGYLFDGVDYSIHQASTYTNDTVVINGRVASAAASGAGVFLEGSHSTITVGALGVISGNTGIKATGSDMTIENDGIVVANGFAAAINVTNDNAHIINNGELIGAAGIYSSSNHAVIENNGHIHGYLTAISLLGNHVALTLGQDSTITALSSAIALSSTTGEKNKVTNDGLIGMSGHIAFNSEDGNDTFINHGTVRGNVNLGGGDDVFNNIDGKFAGTVAGGAGDDVFIVNSAKTAIVENIGEGSSDTVKSSVSLSLVSKALAGSDIEDLTLLGTKNLHATGNELGNEINGNSGDNILNGGAGLDELWGGKGDDIFVFAKGNGTDEVEDFGHGADRIDVSSFTTIHDFKDLMKHTVEDVGKGNVYIDIGMNEMILQDHAKADLHASQFIFA